MSSDFDDSVLRAAFADYRRTRMTSVRPEGVEPAQRGGLARRRRRHGFLSAITALAFAVPGAAFALVSAKSVPPLGSPSPTPISSVSLPKDGLTRSRLLASSMSMPAFEGDATGACPQGEVALADPRLELFKRVPHGNMMTYVDVDQDGSFETVLHVRCRAGETVVAEQVVVVAPGTASNLLVVGRVVGTGGEVTGIGWLSTLSDGTVTVEVAGPRACCPGFQSATERQSRQFAWYDAAFHQVAGSTAFGVDKPADLRVETSEVRFVDAIGTLKVTVTNIGPQRVENVMVRLTSTGVRFDGAHWYITTRTAPTGAIEYFRYLGRIEAGAATTIEAAASANPTSASGWKLEAMALAMTDRGELNDQLVDATPVDNERIEVSLKLP